MKTILVIAFAIMILSACATEPEPSRGRMPVYQINEITINRNVISLNVNCSAPCLDYKFDFAEYFVRNDTVHIAIYGVLHNVCMTSIGQVQAQFDVMVGSPGTYVLHFDSFISDPIADTTISIHW